MIRRLTIKCVDVYIACAEEAAKRVDEVCSVPDKAYFGTSELSDRLYVWKNVESDSKMLLNLEKVMSGLDKDDSEETAYKYIEIADDRSVSERSNRYGSEVFLDTYVRPAVEIGCFK